MQITLPVTAKDISVIVSDGTNPISFANVTAGNVSGVTDSNGKVSSEDVPRSVTSINVTSEGYEDGTESVTIDDEHTSFTVELTPIVYDYTSYDGETEMDTGTVKPTGVGTANWVQVEVLTATSIPEWEGTKVYVTRDIVADGETKYFLYMGAGTQKTEFEVVISEHT